MKKLREAGKKRGSKNVEVKAPKRRRFVAGLVEGKSMYRAALDAGYSKSMAKNAGQKILPGARNEFKDELARKIPRAMLIRRIAEGLNAKETKLAQFEGGFSDERHLVAWETRRRYAELAAKLLGYLGEKPEVGNSEDGPLSLELNIHFIDPEKPAELLHSAAAGIDGGE
jgi:hypothetical protein